MEKSWPRRGSCQLLRKAACSQQSPSSPTAHSPATPRRGHSNNAPHPRSKFMRGLKRDTATGTGRAKTGSDVQNSIFAAMTASQLADTILPRKLNSVRLSPAQGVPSSGKRVCLVLRQPRDWDMAEKFDPYYRWLGIPAKEQPPNHYRLLGIELFESDPQLIDSFALASHEFPARDHRRSAPARRSAAVERTGCSTPVFARPAAQSGLRCGTAGPPGGG